MFKQKVTYKKTFDKEAFTKKWKQLAREGKIRRYDMALLALYRSTTKSDPLAAAVRYLTASFKPATNKNKLANGYYPYHAMWAALKWLSSDALRDLLSEFTEEQMNQMIEIRKHILPDPFVRNVMIYHDKFYDKIKVEREVAMAM